MKGVAIAMVPFLLSFAVLICMVQPSQAITCQQVDTSLLPCISYLENGGSTPSNECCNGVRNIKQITPTTPDRRAACECIKQAASRYHSAIKPDAAIQLPKLCAVDVGVPITPNIDCNQ
ncbi:hypothetical protein Tsubulata_050864 [Turnera subulata]|uniref:Non-specific lipid-transfer protein n=1 Tax=Turnera subulata TaxID=218843 RepID=A0A9Q0G2K5_9ROSI|nr:hypothetical protein Tsubulata_050864 [Turnera subulata]